MRKNIFLANKKKIRLLVTAIGLALSITACGCGEKQRVSENDGSIEAELTQNTRQIDKVTENNSENQKMKIKT